MANSTRTRPLVEIILELVHTNKVGVMMIIRSSVAFNNHTKDSTTSSMAISIRNKIPRGLIEEMHNRTLRIVLSIVGSSTEIRISSRTTNRHTNNTMAAKGKGVGNGSRISTTDHRHLHHDIGSLMFV